MKLTAGEIQSALWQKLGAYLEERLDRYRLKNDGNLDHDYTAKLRGRIAELKEMLALAEPEAPAQAAENGDE